MVWQLGPAARRRTSSPPGRPARSTTSMPRLHRPTGHRRPGQARQGPGAAPRWPCWGWRSRTTPATCAPRRPRTSSRSWCAPAVRSPSTTRWWTTAEAEQLFGLPLASSLAREAVEEADCIAILALHREFADIDFAGLPVAATALCVDGRAYYSKDKIAELRGLGLRLPGSRADERADRASPVERLHRRPPHRTVARPWRRGDGLRRHRAARPSSHPDPARRRRHPGRRPRSPQAITRGRRHRLPPGRRGRRRPVPGPSAGRHRHQLHRYPQRAASGPPSAGAKVVVASTSEVFGKNPAVPWREDDDRVLGTTAADRWTYSSSKALAEHLTFAFVRQPGLEATIVRYFNAYGPRQRPGFVVSRVGAPRAATASRCWCTTAASRPAASPTSTTRSPARSRRAPPPRRWGSASTSAAPSRRRWGTSSSWSPSWRAGIRRSRSTRATASAPPTRTCRAALPDTSKARAVLGWGSATALRDGLAGTIELGAGQPVVAGAARQRLGLTARADRPGMSPATIPGRSHLFGAAGPTRPAGARRQSDRAGRRSGRAAGRQAHASRVAATTASTAAASRWGPIGRLSTSSGSRSASGSVRARTRRRRRRASGAARPGSGRACRCRPRPAAPSSPPARGAHHEQVPDRLGPRRARAGSTRPATPARPSSSARRRRGGGAFQASSAPA